MSDAPITAEIINDDAGTRWVETFPDHNALRERVMHLTFSTGQSHYGNVIEEDDNE